MKRSHFVFASVAAVAAIAPASASAHFFTCRASAARVVVDNPLINVFSEPEVANQNVRDRTDPDPFCHNDFREAASARVPGGMGPPLLAASVLQARTIWPDCALPCRDTLGADAYSHVAQVVVNLGMTHIVATVLTAHATASCDKKSKETLNGSSSLASLVINGKPVIDLNQSATIPASPLVTVYINRKIMGRAKDGDIFLTRRALEVSSPLLGADVVLAEATADFSGAACTST
jgi:hypothetical protein